MFKRTSVSEFLVLKVIPFFFNLIFKSSELTISPLKIIQYLPSCENSGCCPFFISNIERRFIPIVK